MLYQILSAGITDWQQALFFGGAGGVIGAGAAPVIYVPVHVAGVVVTRVGGTIVSALCLNDGQCDNAVRLVARSWREAERVLGQYLNTTKNTIRYYRADYPGLIGNYRVPDFVTNNFIADAKFYSVSRLTLSDQLRDFVTIAHIERVPLYIYTHVNTVVTPRAMDLIKSTGGKVIDIFVGP